MLLKRFGPAALAVSLLGFAALGAQAQEKVTLKFATFTPAQTFAVKGLVEPFLDRVVADSQGTLDYKVYGGGTLGRNPAAQLKLVQDGIADIGFVVPSYTPGALDPYSVTQIPAIADTTESLTVALWKLLEDGLLPEPAGTKVLGFLPTSKNGLHLAGAYDGVESLKGVKIRVAGGVQSDMAAYLGMVPVGNIGAPATAESISRGVTEATFMDWGASFSFKVDQVTKKHVNYPFGAVAIMLPMNIDTWNALPDPARAAFEKHMGMPYAISSGRAQDEFTANGIAKYKDAAGQDVITPDAADIAILDAASRKTADAWAAREPAYPALLAKFREYVK